MMIEVMIDSIRVSLTNQQRIVILKDVKREWYLPIWIGPFEAESITIGLQNIEISRPQTHDLMLSVIQSLGFQFSHIEIKFMQQDVFFADLVVKDAESGEERRIDCRPSDALALSARKKTRIFVSDEIMQQAGILPEENVHHETTDDDNEGLTFEPQDEERLSIFEDFLERLTDEEDTDDDDSDDSSSNN
ncbi:MAG TPA: bifunctional nuclease family protein [Chloroflexi bacterium]|nr:bifunctional nuclease family protein [Chloroflexota bacterium]